MAHGTTIRVSHHPEGIEGPPIIVGGVELLTTSEDQETAQNAPTKSLASGQEITQRNVIEPESGALTGWTETAGVAELRSLAQEKEPISISTSEGTITRCVVESVSRTHDGQYMDAVEVEVVWRQILVAQIGTATIQAVTSDGASYPSAQSTPPGSENTVLGSDSQTASSGPTLAAELRSRAPTLNSQTVAIQPLSTLELSDDDLPGTTTVSDLSLSTDDTRTTTERTGATSTADTTMARSGQLTPESLTTQAVVGGTAIDRGVQSDSSLLLGDILGTISNWRTEDDEEIAGGGGLQITQFDGVRLPTRRFRNREPVAITLRDHPAWPSNTLRLYFDWNLASEQWTWEVEVDGHGTVIGPAPVSYGKGYQYGGYFGFVFVDLSRGTETVTPSNLGETVTLVGIPGPQSDGYREWVTRQASRDPTATESTVAAFLDAAEV